MPEREMCFIHLPSSRLQRSASWDIAEQLAYVLGNRRRITRTRQSDAPGGVPNMFGQLAVGGHDRASVCQTRHDRRAARCYAVAIGLHEHVARLQLNGNIMR